MISDKSFDVITSFPNFKQPDFCVEEYNRQFNDRNIIINAKSSDVYYAEHWGPLSIKCAFNGKEYYKVNNADFAATDEKYLILNNGNYYSSYIDSDSEVESFTINFKPSLVNETVQSLCKTDQYILDNFGYAESGYEFYEILYRHDEIVSPLIFQLKQIVANHPDDENSIAELYTLLIEKIILKQKELQKEIFEIPAKKSATKKELYKRLTRAKDYMDSSYNKEITIEKLASVSLLNQTYFLRQFKNYYKITPKQYLILKRMEAAKAQLELKKEISITELCAQVGYNDLSSFSKLFKHFFQHSPDNYHKLFYKR